MRRLRSSLHRSSTTPLLISMMKRICLVQPGTGTSKPATHIRLFPATNLRRIVLTTSVAVCACRGAPPTAERVVKRTATTATPMTPTNPFPAIPGMGTSRPATRTPSVIKRPGTALITSIPTNAGRGVLLTAWRASLVFVTRETMPVTKNEDCGQTEGQEK